MGCALCGKSHGPRWERCYITEDTQRRLLAQADALKGFGVTLSEGKQLQKGIDTIGVAGLVLAVAESATHGVLRDLIISLHEWGVARNEILRLRLTEPEDVDKILSDKQ
jgi:hypothetical protein